MQGHSSHYLHHSATFHRSNIIYIYIYNFLGKRSQHLLKAGYHSPYHFWRQKENICVFHSNKELHILKQLLRKNVKAISAIQTSIIEFLLICNHNWAFSLKKRLYAQRHCPISTSAMII